jgi:hypothetical protein
VWIAPRPFLVGAANIPFNNGIAVLTRRLPTGTTWRLKWPLFKYTDTVVANAQTSPNLSFLIYDMAFRQHADLPTLIKQITGPAGFPGLDATQQLDYDFPGGGTVRAEVRGQVGGAPASVSICLYGFLGWQRL